MQAPHLKPSGIEVLLTGSLTTETCRLVPLKSVMCSIFTWRACVGFFAWISLGATSGRVERSRIWALNSHDMARERLDRKTCLQVDSCAKEISSGLKLVLYLDLFK